MFIILADHPFCHFAGEGGPDLIWVLGLGLALNGPVRHNGSHLGTATRGGRWVVCSSKNSDRFRQSSQIGRKATNRATFEKVLLLNFRTCNFLGYFWKGVGLFILFLASFTKRAFNPNFEKLRKNLKKYVYQHDSFAILATHWGKKFEKKFHVFLKFKFRPSCFK